MSAWGSLIPSGPFAGLVKNGYRVILADPPWTFKTFSDEGKGRSPEMHYPCMDIEAIKALPVADLAAPNAVVFMWVIDTYLPMALDVMAAWGFTYKTVGFYWAKTNADGSPFTGMGYWTRANPEQCWFGLDAEAEEGRHQCLLGTIRSPGRKDMGVKRLIMAPRREHSRKPDETHERIERLVRGPYIELFARQQRPGWAAWGNETGKFVTPPPRRGTPERTYLEALELL